MEQIINYLESFNQVSIIIRLVLATLFGGIIGIEREAKRHSAGFRTFTLVCLGSALATIVNLYLWDITGNTDTARISAAVVSGVGFLGVGTIIVTSRNQVRSRLRMMTKTTSRLEEEQQRRPYRQRTRTAGCLSRASTNVSLHMKHIQRVIHGDSYLAWK